MNLWNNIVVTTDKGIFHIKDGKFISLHALPLAYGFSWDEKNIFATAYQGVYIFEKNFRVKSELGMKFDLHQCLYYENALYVCNTRQNIIKIINVQNVNLVSDFAFPGSERHLNSLFFKDGELYVCLHGNCNMHSCNTNKGRHSKILKLNLNKEILQSWVKTGCGSHNVFLENDFLYTLNSLFGSITKINTNTNEMIDVSIPLASTMNHDEKVFPRGFAKNKDTFYIGVAQQASRDKRNLIKSYLYAFDQELNFIESFEFPDLHHIRDVRLINQVDFAHQDLVLEL